MGAWKLSTACLASRLRQSREDAPGRPSKTSLDIDRYRPKTGRFELPVKIILGNQVAALVSSWKLAKASKPEKSRGVERTPAEVGLDFV